MRKPSSDSPIRAERKMIHMDEKELKKAKEEAEADYGKFADAVKKQTTTIDEAEEAKIKAFMEKMAMPIELKDEDVQLSPREIDVRGLSEKSYRQLMYKFTVAESSMLNSLDQSLVDIQRLLMLVLKKMGAKDVVGELDELCEEIQKQAKELTKKRKA